MSLFNSLSVSASGMNAERQRAEVLVENIANADTTRTATGGPYHRQDVVFQSQDVSSPFSSIFDSQMSSQASSQANGVAIGQVITDQSEPDRRYMPGHPDADKDGYVAYPKINPAEDMVDLLGASRSYEANVSAITAVKDMIQRSIDLFR
jgi:flagellar basal-body rod protein FlgC